MRPFSLFTCLGSFWISAPVASYPASSEFAVCRGTHAGRTASKNNPDGKTDKIEKRREAAAVVCSLFFLIFSSKF
ncbi:hypothetical protein MRX96_042946 [Rhipicephalus microplus]